MFLIRFALHKLAATVPVLLAASVLAFALAGAGSHRAGTATDLASQAISAPERYAQYIFVALRGDFGASIRSGQRIGPLLLERAPATAELAALSFGCALAFGVPAGLFVTLRRRTWSGQAALAVMAIAGSVPTVVSGVLLTFVAVDRLHLLPRASGGGGLVLPVLTLSVVQAVPLMRVDAPPQRLNAKDTPVPFHPNLWAAHRPTVRAIAAAARKILRQ